MVSKLIPTSLSWARLCEAARSLQFKATALVVLLTLCVTASVSGYLLQAGAHASREQHNQYLVRIAGTLAHAAGRLMAQNQIAELDTLAQDVVDGAPLLYLSFYDATGKELVFAGEILPSYHENPDTPPRPGTPVAHRATRGVPPFLEVTYPISCTVEQPDAGPTVQHLGYLRTGMTVEGWERSVANTLDVVTGVGIIAIALAIPLGFMLVRRIVTPLSDLAQVMHQFSQGRLEVRAPVRRADEIGSIRAAFNRMADQHQSNHEHLVRLNAELEERVAQRTRQLRELASREPLTGLYNRRRFNEILEQQFAEASRYGTDLTCLMIDLDNFKEVNDGFGHPAGDRLLLLTAQTVTSQLRTADVAARYGGDEFVVLLPQTDAERARVLAERISEKLALELGHQMPKVRVSLSIGIASLRQLKVDDPATLVHSADAALYQAKDAGKACIMTAEVATHPTAA